MCDETKQAKWRTNTLSHGLMGAPAAFLSVPTPPMGPFIISEAHSASYLAPEGPKAAHFHAPAPRVDPTPKNACTKLNFGLSYVCPHTTHFGAPRNTTAVEPLEMR